MKYLKIKKKALVEIIISSLGGMLISLICVLYLTVQIRELKMQNYNLELRLDKALYDLAISSDIVEDSEKIQNTLTTSSEKQSTKQASYNVNNSDRDLLAQILYCEGRGESIECQRAIVSVIINRWQSGKWGKTISDVVYAKGQFEPVSSGALSNAKPSQTQYDVVDYVLANGVTLPSWVMYFRASYHFNWKGYTAYCNLSNTYFGGYK